MTFTAKVEGGDKDDMPTYAWKISAGKIVEGQGTNTIKVSVKNLKEVTATVEIGGLYCEECEREAAFKTKFR